ncbi:hypothetical protein [Bacillus cereus]|uniref:Uncharacterized protein n=1 Tax=Bacillus cereus VD184 TaxID=1053242 RepID=A0A9W5R5S6_BACCE|nr:hypothetical protein [Bacillus cereus]EOQ09136.1 hypothetical protein IKC_06100 [Bacillus cereus VD184]
MATRIFTVKHGTETEKGIRKLIRKGVSGLPDFEKQLDVLDFCWDMEVIENPKEKQYILMISGCTNGVADYENDDLEEITKEQLNAFLPIGRVLLFAGTHELVEEAGYKLDKRHGSFYEVRLVS